MKKLFLSTLLLALPLLASAYDIEVKNADGVTIYYNYINNGTELEVADAQNVAVVNIPEEVTYMGRTRKVTSIGESAFSYCQDLTSLTIPNSVTTIGRYAFYYCTGLTSVTIPNSVTSIGKYAFADCSGLSTIAIPNSVTIIGNWAFRNCGSLTSITIPNSVTTIGYEAFRDCNRLTSVHITDLAAWCKIAFHDYTSNPLCFAQQLYLNGEEIKDLVIPNLVTTIGDLAFSGCSGLTSVTIPNSVTTIGGDAFSYCRGLNSVTIPNSVTTIGSFAFRGCSSLTSVTIPNSVTSIGRRAFYECNGLTSVFSKMENPYKIDSDCFSNKTFYDGTLYVPKGTIDKYKSTNYWSKFVHIEEEKPSIIETINREEYEVSHESERYDASGSHINNIRQGLNIIRMSDGKVKKVMVK